MPGATPQRVVTGFATTPESIRICLPSGCGSFWLKEKCSSVGVSPWIRLLSEILFELSKIFRNAPNANFYRLPKVLKYLLHRQRQGRLRARLKII
jgi:hypothetical protein